MQVILYKYSNDLWARGVVGLTRLPVTEEIAGSNPVGPANVLMFKDSYSESFYFSQSEAPVRGLRNFSQSFTGTAGPRSISMAPCGAKHRSMI